MSCGIPLSCRFTTLRNYHVLVKKTPSRASNQLWKMQSLNTTLGKNFSTWIALRNPRGFLRRIKRLILKRIVVFRLIFYGSLILGVSTIVNVSKNEDIERSISPSYFLEHTPKPGERYKLSGVIVKDSIEMKKGTQDNKFRVTDYKNSISVLFKGTFPQTFREGDMCYLGGFLADPEDPTLFIATSVQANHEISVDKYIGDSNVDRFASLNMIEPTADFEYAKISELR
ncbi:unnamed protein product [Moneuplotes crassus]|uniref:Cytochrome c maturation protein CcmE n=1 Tax=Euplotes crassus TaxID=5936 RepID=A0AAD1XUY7_EUPCR|nr:unnamed protein product [Moneuplotes crassus]